MPLSLLVVLVLLIGVVVGLRSMTGPALVCWGSYLGWLSLAHTPLGFLSSKISLVIFSLLAVGELVADKLPKTPSRISAVPLGARLVSGALCGAALVLAAGIWIVVGLAAGAIGALLGAFAGYHVRRALTSGNRFPDLPVALLEDLIAIGTGLFVVSRF
ncbi:MAG TPA: DUF4126 family protein [Acidobacteriaceae bacterium]